MLKLLEDLEGRGHHVYTDNYYSSPALFGDLQHLGFGACGTVRKNRCGKIVLKLLECLEGRGHHIYTDNYYSSPALFGDLQHLGFGACGTVRKNRCGKIVLKQHTP